MADRVRPPLVVRAKEFFWGSGTVHPDVVEGLNRPSHDDQGSVPLPAGSLAGKGAGPADGVQGNNFMRSTRYDGGKLIEYYTDYWISTQTGALLTDGRKVRIKYIVAEDNVAESYWVRPHDHILKIKQYDLSTQGFTVLLPSLNPVGGANTIPMELQSFTGRGLVADNQVDRQFWGRELYIESHGLKGAGDIFIRQSVDLTQAGYMWTQSTVPNEWYLTLEDGTTPGLVNDNVFYIADVLSASGVVGNLVAGEHGFGNNDGLGFTTFYVFSTVDPDTMQIHAAYGQIARITVINEKFHIVSYWDQLANAGDGDVRWNVLQHCVVTTSTTTSTTTTTTTTTTSTTSTGA